LSPLEHEKIHKVKSSVALLADKAFF